MTDGFLFYLMYTQKGKSMDYLAGKLNIHRSRILKLPRATRQSYSDRAMKLPEEFYKEACCEISSIIDDMYNLKK
jgi:hypothetical protein